MNHSVSSGPSGESASRETLTRSKTASGREASQREVGQGFESRPSEGRCGETPQDLTELDEFGEPEHDC